MARPVSIACVVDAKRLRELNQTEAAHQALVAHVALLRRRMGEGSASYRRPAAGEGKLQGVMLQLRAIIDCFEHAHPDIPLEPIRHLFDALHDHDKGRKSGSLLTPKSNFEHAKDGSDEWTMKAYLWGAVQVRRKALGEGFDCAISRVLAESTAANSLKGQLRTTAKSRLERLVKETGKGRGYEEGSDEAAVIDGVRKALSLMSAMQSPERHECAQKLYTFLVEEAENRFRRMEAVPN